MPILYTEADADLKVLQGRTIGAYGYDDFARAVLLNLRDSGFTSIVGEANERRAEQARDDGFEVVYPSEISTSVRLLLVPDEALPEVYLAHISPTLHQGDLLMFPSGYSIAFGYIEPPPFVDAVMIAPRANGPDLRDAYMHQRGVLSFIAVAQDSSGRAWERLLALARAFGALRGGAIELTFQQEAELDLFVQQAVMPALQNLMLIAADILIGEGYPPEAALLDLYVSGALADMLGNAARHGMMDTLKLHTLIGQYGMLSREARFHDVRLRRQMELVLEEIRSGKFAQEWANEYLNGYPRLEALRGKRGAMSLWTLERRVIELLQQVDDTNRDSDGQA